MTSDSESASAPSPLDSREGIGDELRIVFIGTPQFAVPALHALLECRQVAGRPAHVVAVVTQPDRPAGRGGRVQASPVKEVALSAGVPVLQPERLRRRASTEELRAYRPELIVVAAFAQILSQAVLDMPAHGCLNVHASLLPRWRGASPISAAILAGDRETGVTIMRMDAGLDTGPILLQRGEPIGSDDTTGALTGRLSYLGARLLDEALDGWVAGILPARAQPEEGVTLTRPLTREDGHVDWSAAPAIVVERMIRAYDPWPGVYAVYSGRTLKLWAAEALDGEHAAVLPPGHVLDRAEAAPILQRIGLRWPQLVVQASDGPLLLRRVQSEGKRAMGGDEFLRGQQAVAGTTLT